MTKTDLLDVIECAVNHGTNNTNSIKRKIDKLQRKIGDIDKTLESLKDQKHDITNQIIEYKTYANVVNSMISILKTENKEEKEPRERMSTSPVKVYSSSKGRVSKDYVGDNKESGRKTIGKTTGKPGPKVGSSWSKEHRENYEATLKARKNQ